MSEEMLAIAAELHEAWRGDRRRPDGTYEPRLKPDGEGGLVDIANTPFAALPRRWQEENLRAAESAEHAVITAVTLEDAARHVHDEWIERNVEWAEEEQRTPYDAMPEAEKAKDRRVALIVSRLTRRPLADPTHRQAHAS